jgi:flavorubredoxin
VRDVDIFSVGGYDCIIVGSPTHAWKPTAPVSEFLDKLTPQVASGKSAAAFDTRVKSLFSGGASGSIEGKLKKLGFKIAAPALAVYVRGEESASKELNKRVFKLVDGELEKARRFAEQAVKSSQ